MKKELVNKNEIKKAQLRLRAINNKTRLSILNLIDSQKEMNVTDIYVALRIVQSVASQHLAVLRKSNIVNAERKGKEIIYSINYETLNKVANLCNLINSI